MPVSVHKKAPANVSDLQHLNNGAHHGDIFGNEDGGPHITIGILSITKHDGGGTAAKAPHTVYVIVTEGEISVEDAAKPGDISVLEPGDITRIDKGTTATISSSTSGKAYYISQHEFGIDLKEHLV
ncbi:hypothetical protein K443DRAFT_261108 [Laccaria amethystina LaAM-08-1]|uniref:Unplaced genomic scaffold K443scaffold_169, whole genome shotgun sequence n=1 Tax=Laccaria amethystina LaAM-08-1 TaxID=1095629 RepID=A0A0C9WWP5_9AGAR|nr:hypothetical protein K443DRAFT_261108 [Laccaria amethystina LaAM-08-1]